LGQHISTSIELTPIDEERQLSFVPKDILVIRERNLKNQTFREYLVKWKDFPIEEATWEGEKLIQHTRLIFLEGKQSWVGRTVMSPAS